LRSAEVSGLAAPPGERSFPVVHVSTVPLPLDMADYGSDVVEDLGSADALVVLKEFDPADATQALFARDGMPRVVSAADFDESMLQRRLEGQGGYQEFFHEGQRAFCVYVVVGSFAQREQIVPAINGVLASLRIQPLSEESNAP
jgi:hypothetical protein